MIRLLARHRRRRYNHVAPNDAIEASRAFGVPAVAVCGHVWHPDVNRPDLPPCPKCQAVTDEYDLNVEPEPQPDYAHLVPASAVAASDVFGVPAVAICGHIVPPSPPGEPELPECQRCVSFAASRLTAAGNVSPGTGETPGR